MQDIFSIDTEFRIIYLKFICYTKSAYGKDFNASNTKKINLKKWTQFYEQIEWTQ